MKDKIVSCWIRHSTLIELWIGIVLWCMGLQLVLLFIPGDKASAAAGLWIGGIFALLIAKHMEWSLSRALVMGEAGAKKRVWLDYLIRYFAMAALLTLVAVSGIGDVIACFMGLLCVKLSAYINTPLHRISVKVCGAEVFERELVPPEVQDELYGKKEA